MSKSFQDLNFKLCVIQELMYNQSLIQPKFDIYEFVKNHKGRKIDIEREGYGVIPEALAYFEALEIPADMLMNVTEIYQDGGNEIYMQLCPFWDGEDSLFDITNVDDVSLLPNLKKMTIFYGEDKSILDALRAKNIEADYL